MLPSTKNINNEVSSNHKDEVATMMAVAIKLSDAVTHYASHHLCANVQSSAIDKNMQSMKIYLSIIYMGP